LRAPDKADGSGDKDGRAEGFRGTAAFDVERHASARIQNVSADLVQPLSAPPDRSTDRPFGEGGNDCGN
jgi:hypothetical protein